MTMTRRPSFGYASVTSNVVDGCAVESPPTQTSKVEESVSQSWPTAFQYVVLFDPARVRATRRQGAPSRPHLFEWG
jgi:hypothetical protein